MGLGAAGWVNGAVWGKWVVLAGVIGLFLTLYFWFGDAIQESESGFASGISLDGLLRAVDAAQAQLQRPLGGRSMAWLRRQAG
ncbi:hypothetical protein L510_4962, partial [Bordetella bronchiseptica MBORD591]